MVIHLWLFAWMIYVLYTHNLDVIYMEKPWRVPSVYITQNWYLSRLNAWHTTGQLLAIWKWESHKEEQESRISTHVYVNMQIWLMEWLKIRAILWKSPQPVYQPQGDQNFRSRWIQARIGQRWYECLCKTLPVCYTLEKAFFSFFLSRKDVAGR